jgi:hypothetical protein
MRARWIGWLPEERAWIAARADWPRADLHRAFVAFWLRPEVSLQAFRAFCKREGIMTGRTGCIEKGAVPPNKGKPMPPHVRAKVSASMFRKGHLPHNTKGAGHERVGADGYVWVSVDEVNPYTGFERRYVQKHRWLWEQENGPVPEGHVLKCLDANKLNTDPSNWECIPLAVLPRLNGKFGRGYDGAEPEIKPVIMAIAKLEHAARQARRAS